MTAVLLIGLSPSFINPNDPGAPPGTTIETITQRIESGLQDMRARGWTASFCAVPPDETAEATIGKSLAEQAWDVIVVGGGLRLPPKNFELFERVVNAVHRGAPNAAIAFNSSPETTAKAASRWLPDGS